MKLRWRALSPSLIVHKEGRLIVNKVEKVLSALGPEPNASVKKKKKGAKVQGANLDTVPSDLWLQKRNKRLDLQYRVESCLDE